MVDEDEAARLFPVVYDAVRGDIPGAVGRSEDKWRLYMIGDADWMRAGGGPKYRAVLEVDGEPRGFTIYRVKSDWGPTGPASTLRVLEVYGLDPTAEQALWEWLFAMDLIGTITAWRSPVPHPLQQWLLEPRRLGLTVQDGMWLRILDVPAALSARTYAGSGTLVLDVADSLIESNAGRWQLAVKDGSATVTRTRAEADFELDVAALASTYLGAFRFGDLATAGRVRECQPGSLKTADMLWRGSTIAADRRNVSACKPSTSRTREVAMLNLGGRTGRIHAAAARSDLDHPIDVCAPCEHHVVFHGRDTEGCGRIFAAGWCECRRSFGREHAAYVATGEPVVSSLRPPSRTGRSRRA